MDSSQKLKIQFITVKFGIALIQWVFVFLSILAYRSNELTLSMKSFLVLFGVVMSFISFKIYLSYENGLKNRYNDAKNAPRLNRKKRRKLAKFKNKYTKK